MKRLLVVVLLIAGVTVFSFSTGKSESTAQKITITHVGWTETSNDKIELEAVNQFQAKHPNVTVKLQLVPNEDRLPKIRTALAANGDLDSFAMNNGESAEFFEAGQVVPIDPQGFGKSTIQEVLDMWEPGALQRVGAYWEGKYYGLPWELSDYVAWINVADMKAAGLDPATDLPKTWDDFVRVGKKLVVESGGIRTRNGFATNAKASIFSFLIMSAMMEQLGLDWGTEKGLLASMDNTAALAKGMKTFTDFVVASKIWDPSVSPEDREGFGDNKTAMFLTGGTWYWGVLDTYSVPRKDVRPFAYPRFADGKDVGGMGYGAAQYVTRLAKNPKLTWEWLDTITSFTKEFEKLGTIQPRIKLSDGSQAFDPSIVKQSIPYYDEVFRPELARTASWLVSTKSAQVEDAVWQAISSVIYSNGSVDAAVSKLQSDIRAIYK